MRLQIGLFLSLKLFFYHGRLPTSLTLKLYFTHFFRLLMVTLLSYVFNTISAYHHWSELESCSGEVYLIQHYVIKFVSDLWQIGGFLRALWLPQPIKLTTTILTEILLKVVLNTITLTPWCFVVEHFPITLKRQMFGASVIYL